MLIFKSVFEVHGHIVSDLLFVSSDDARLDVISNIKYNLNDIKKLRCYSKLKIALENDDFYSIVKAINSSKNYRVKIEQVHVIE